MAVGLRDVARLAGVSVKTVSNVVHDYPHVSDETRKRVEGALVELGYKPNLSARHLRGGRSGVLALAVPELREPYFAELAQNVVSEADRKGYTVLIDQTEGRPSRERLVLEGIRAQLIDGLIFSPLALGRRDLARRVDATPMVLLGERVSGEVADHVAIDNVAAARQAVAYLASLGRRRVAAIGAQHMPSGTTARLRLLGYRQALEQAGLAYDPDLVAETPTFHRAEGRVAMQRLLAHARPDAVFAFNDLLALGAMRACFEAGAQVPDDVAVVGFDDIEEGTFTTPSLTTVAPDKPAIAATAVGLVLARIGCGAACLPREVVASHTLLVRESTAGAHARLSRRPPEPPLAAEGGI